MGYLFNRKAELIIRKKGEVISPTFLSLSQSLALKRPGYVPTLKIEVTAKDILISDLRIKFKIDKNSESSANQSTIEIYNLNENTRGLLKKDDVCILKVGYENNTNVIFIGDIGTITSEKKDTDIITKIEVGDSQLKLKETYIEKNFVDGVKVSDVIKDIVDKFKLPVVYKTELGQEQFSTGYSASGNVKTIMDSVLKRLGFTWSIQDNVIYINKPDVKDTVEYVVISENTGLIGSPVKKEEGIEFVSLIQPSLKPETTIKLISSKLEGLYKIRQALYEGDTHEGVWQVRCIVK